MSLPAVARWEARAVLRDRWFLAAAGAFGLLVLASALVALAAVDVLGVSAFGRAAATLIHLGMLFIPLIGLTVGAVWIAGERESGSLTLVLSQPVDRRIVFSGKFCGVAWGMTAAVVVGFGAAGLLLALRAGTERIPAFLWLVALSVLLALAMLATGFLISAASPSRSRALGAALGAWLGLVVLSDLGLLGTAMVLRLPAPALLILGSLNPVGAYRLAAIVGITGSADLTGPVGLYAVDRLGSAGLAAALVLVLILWTAVAYLAGRARFLAAVEG
ncbi:MAG: ABC transporter permease subunit [Armatimonadota bacterium]|nr:ABC transporter permease subunit [Armatimonadota bacterium]MDR7450550.1 ABC transporter permease subunit [Armatimonadota bacterium]MDR7466317.1 ABC transporter permease subunit [Armatimonadota bacterium]MDR7493038.1 ABC transporter permease subunit [Armatimonadota bacterium]MDR7498205.1 ABC transporter permease subunit [Armatimonadota bacterium]